MFCLWTWSWHLVLLTELGLVISCYMPAAEMYNYLFSSEENCYEHYRRAVTKKVVFHVRVTFQYSPCVPAFKFCQGTGRKPSAVKFLSSFLKHSTSPSHPLPREKKRKRICSHSNSSMARQLIQLVLLSLTWRLSIPQLPPNALSPSFLVEPSLLCRDVCPKS